MCPELSRHVSGPKSCPRSWYGVARTPAAAPRGTSPELIAVPIPSGVAGVRIQRPDRPSMRPGIEAHRGP